jgi:hypothetical protein
MGLCQSKSNDALQVMIARAEDVEMKWTDRKKKIKDAGLELNPYWKFLSDADFEDTLHQMVYQRKNKGLLLQVLPLIHGGFLPVLDVMDPETMGYSKLSVDDLESRISGARQCQTHFIKRVIHDEVEGTLPP